MFPIVVVVLIHDSQHAHLGGEMASHRAQLSTWESDLKEFKDVSKRYTDQLVKVKVCGAVLVFLNWCSVSNADVRHGK